MRERRAMMRFGSPGAALLGDGLCAIGRGRCWGASLLAACVLACLVVAPARADAPNGYTVVGEFGGGTGGSAFTSPLGVAVDQASGDVYVANNGAYAVEKFDAAGNLLASWGWGVTDGQARYEVCTQSCSAGISGSGVDQFSAPAGVAVDPSNGDVYVSDIGNGVVDKFSSDGTPLPFSFTAPAGFEPVGMAVDPATGDLYVADDGNGVVDEFTSSGAPVPVPAGGKAIAATSPIGVAVGSNGTVYVQFLLARRRCSIRRATTLGHSMPVPRRE